MTLIFFFYDEFLHYLSLYLNYWLGLILHNFFFISIEGIVPFKSTINNPISDFCRLSNYNNFSSSAEEKQEEIIIGLNKLQVPFQNNYFKCLGISFNSSLIGSPSTFSKFLQLPVF